MLSQRILKESKRLTSAPDPGISATPHVENARYFDVVIAGPQSSPYEGGLFRLELFLNEGYPMEPPKVRFLTKLYHPNVDKLGRICLDILSMCIAFFALCFVFSLSQSISLSFFPPSEDKWSPALQIRTVLLSIQALLSEPNPDDPLGIVFAVFFFSFFFSVC